MALTGNSDGVQLMRWRSGARMPKRHITEGHMGAPYLFAGALELRRVTTRHSGCLRAP
jgi:hypothetical protein